VTRNVRGLVKDSREGGWRMRWAITWASDEAAVVR